MKEFKTPKGTVLPLLDLKGKPYLQVAHRILWFREEHPSWSIKTSIKIEAFGSDVLAIGSAEIINESGVVLANATKWEPFQDLSPEKAETGAIGRALGLLGFGTQFAMDYEEGDRLADAPLESKDNKPQKPEPIPNVAPGKAPIFKKPDPPRAEFGLATALSDEIITFGKYKGQTFAQVGVSDLQNYVDFLKKSSAKDNKPMNETAKRLAQQADYWFQEQKAAAGDLSAQLLDEPPMPNSEEIPF